MPLAVGSTLGPYQVTAAIGAGGMGQVFRARDTKLNRDVAIKVLPDAFLASPDRLARFKREAQTLASLNHPNIAQIYGFEEASGTSALVMELVEGPTLGDLIAQRPLSISDALPIARQIADALAAAHAQGIIHRDLKPANIKIRTDGTVKVLDFGLAKTADQADTSSGGYYPYESPTVTSPAVTELGVILGTAAYMSPEQARGRGVDKRSDMWAFGAVLFEMLSGQRPFAGDDITETLANVLKTEPAWSALPKGSPPRVMQVIRACLQKNPDERLADAQDAKLALDGAFDSAAPATPTLTSSPTSRRSLLAAVVATVVAGVAGAVAAWFLKPTLPVTAPLSRMSLTLPADRPLFQGGTPHRSIAISRDGRQVVYVARDPNLPSAQALLAIRSLDTLKLRDLPGTTFPRQPAFSPDGQWISYFSTSGKGTLRKVRVSGGNPVTVVEGVNGANWAFADWTDDDRIVFGGGNSEGLRIVSAGGGEPKPLTTVSKQDDEVEHLTPSVARTARAVLFTVRYGKLRDPDIAAVSLDTGERRQILENAISPVVLDTGHLIFQRDEAVFVVPFDEARLAVTGTPVPLPDDVRRDASALQAGVGQFAASRSGRLVYFPSIDLNLEAGFVTRAGEYTRINVPPAVYSSALLSPDGERLALTARALSGVTEVSVFDLARGGMRRLTQAGADIAMAWHPTQPALAITVSRQAADAVVLRGLDGTERVLFNSQQTHYLRNGSWSPDGTLLAYTVQDGSKHDIWIATIGETVTTKPWLDSAVAEYSPRFSPNGRWMAYVSDETGQRQVFVRGYPTGDRISVSITGGNGPLWARDGSEIFFTGQHEGLSKVMRVSVTETGSTLKLGQPEPLFEMRLKGPAGFEPFAQSSNGGVRYDIAPDGKRLVVLKAAGTQLSREIVVVDNWLGELLPPGH